MSSVVEDVWSFLAGEVQGLFMDAERVSASILTVAQSQSCLMAFGNARVNAQLKVSFLSELHVRFSAYYTFDNIRSDFSSSTDIGVIIKAMKPTQR